MLNGNQNQIPARVGLDLRGPNTFLSSSTEKEMLTWCCWSQRWLRSWKHLVVKTALEKFSPVMTRSPSSAQQDMIVVWWHTLVQTISNAMISLLRRTLKIKYVLPSSVAAPVRVEGWVKRLPMLLKEQPLLLYIGQLAGLAVMRFLFSRSALAIYSWRLSILSASQCRT